MLAIDHSLFVGLALGLLLGAAIAAPATYILTTKFKKLSVAIAFYEGREAGLKEFRVDRVVTPREEGRIWKDYFLVISERLTLHDMPVSPFWEHKIAVAQKLDTKTIQELTECLTKVADKLLGQAGLRAIVSEFLSSRGGDALKRQVSKST
jgi:hypothetical protein